MSEITSNINWLATIISAVVSFILGWLWYSPKLFGEKWAEGVGISLDNQDGPPAAAMIVQAIGTFLLAWVVAVMVAGGSLIIMLLILVTLVFLMTGGGLFCKKSAYAIATESGFVVVMTVIMIICQKIL